jgi:hypothetical protein
MRAKSTESSYHHNQFLTMFELLFHLTEDGFEEVESVREEQKSQLSHSNMAHIRLATIPIPCSLFHS